MLTIRRVAIAAAFTTLLPSVSPAATLPMCRNGIFMRTFNPASLVLVSVEGKTPLYDDFNGCPDAGARCIRKTQTGVPLMLPLIAAPAPSDEWACLYVPASKATNGYDMAGYVKRAALQGYTSPLQQPDVTFVGQWEMFADGNQIKITGDKSGPLIVAGDAYWPARSEPRHTGTLRGTAVPINTTLRIARDGCNVRMDLLGPFLLVKELSEQGICGGANVTFSGVYQRIK